MSGESMYTDTLECDGGCGAKIEILSHSKGQLCNAAAEALGWATVDFKKPKDDMEVYCPFCQERARRIVKGIGMENA